MNPNWITLQGAHNARDLGGLPTPDGATRAGVLLRADALDQLTVADVQILRSEWDLAHIVDLRSGGERTERGRGPLGSTDVRYTELEVVGPADLERRAQNRRAAFADGSDAVTIMSDGYIELLELGASAFAEAFQRIAAPGGTPALVHCAAGKDRTGVLVALLLDVAGVEVELIAADYAVSNERMAPIIDRLGAGASYEPAHSEHPPFVFEAVADTMVRFLQHLHEYWDGAAPYFQAHGVNVSTIDAWRKTFIVR